MVHPARNRDGVTLIELLIALLISSIIAGILFQFLLDKGRFVRYQGAREEVQQNTRAALDLIAGELRVVPLRGIEAASQNSITFRAPRVWGVICAPPTGTTVHLAVPASVGANYAVGSSDVTHPMLVATNANVQVTADLQWAAPQAVTAISAAFATCDGTNLPADLERRNLTVASTAGLAVGTTAYLYDRVTYATGISTGIPGFWIRRRVGADGVAFQPFAGPIRALDGQDQGLSFRYFRANGNEISSASALSGDDRNAVARIDVAVESISRQRFGGSPQSKLDRMTVLLRNN